MATVGKATIRWWGPKIVGDLKRHANKGVKLAAEHVRTRVKQRISVSAIVSGGAKNPSPRARKPRKYQHSRAGEPPRTITGSLRRSIFRRHDSQQIVGYVGTNLKYGVGLEKGTKSHIIRPRRKKVLVFPGQTAKGWGWVFSRRVRIPRMRPRPYLKSTLRMEHQRVKTIIFTEMQKAV